MLATMNMRTFALAASSLLLVVATTACTPALKVRGEWQPDVDRSQQFQRLLVVGVSPNYSQRCAFEYAMTASLRGPGVEATASCAKMSSKDPLTREAIEKLVVTTGADAVVATLLVAKSIGAREGGSNDMQGGGYYKPIGYGFDYGYYGVYGAPVVYGEFETAPSVTTIRGNVTLATNVFETRGATLIYGIETRAERLDSRSQALAGIAPAIAERLRKAGLVP
jgi:hypothetical protein